MKYLFVCHAGWLRSRTAADYYAARGYATRAKGTVGLTYDHRINEEDVAWADKIIVFDRENYKRFRNKFWNSQGKAKLVDIEDQYLYMQPELIELIEKLVGPHMA